MIFLLISICISHFNLKSFINFKDNIKTFFLSNYDFSNFATQIIVIVKSFIIYIALTRMLGFDSTESRSILFLSNACFTIAMIINSSIINVIPDIRVSKFYLLSFLISVIVSISLSFLYQFVPELRIPYSNLLIFVVALFASLLSLIVYFYVTKIVINKKSHLLLKYYLFSIMFLLFSILMTYFYSFLGIFIIIVFELAIFFMILLNFNKLK